MSWTDKRAMSTIRDLQKEFLVDWFIETGTFRGINLAAHAPFFEGVLGIESDPSMVDISKYATRRYLNVGIANESSPEALRRIRLERDAKDTEIPLFYLDAHFYDPALPQDKRFVVKQELEALEGYGDCVIVIHDFQTGDPELGHITYDGVPLGWNVVGDALRKVNPNFYYYCNSRQHSDIVTAEDVRKHTTPYPIEANAGVFEALDFVWSSPLKTYRGLLYCTPRPLDLTKYALKEFTYAL